MLGVTPGRCDAVRWARRKKGRDRGSTSGILTLRGMIGFKGIQVACKYIIRLRDYVLKLRVTPWVERTMRPTLPSSIPCLLLLVLRALPADRGRGGVHFYTIHGDCQACLQMLQCRCDVRSRIVCHNSEGKHPKSNPLSF